MSNRRLEVFQDPTTGKIEVVGARTEAAVDYKQCDDN